MTEHISVYIKEIDRLYQTGITTEHSFRPALQRLLQDCTGLIVINEQSHIDCGAPDLTLLRKEMAVAYIEAKELEDADLDWRDKNSRSTIEMKDKSSRPAIQGKCENIADYNTLVGGVPAKVIKTIGNDI